MKFYKLLFLTFCIAFLLQEANAQSGMALHEAYFGRSVQQVQSIMKGVEGMTLHTDGTTPDGVHALLYQHQESGSMMAFYFTKGKCRIFSTVYPKQAYEMCLNNLRKAGFEYIDEDNFWLNMTDKSAASVKVTKLAVQVTYQQYIEKEETP